MNNIRKIILVGIIGYGVSLLFPSVGITASNVENSNSCNIRSETLNIIQKYYGEASVQRTNHIEFSPKHDGMIGEGIFIAENPSVIPFKINFDPSVVNQTVTFIMQRYHQSYHHVSEYVAHYKINGNVSSIAFWASVPDEFGKTKIDMLAITKYGNSVVYACQKVYAFSGDEGCC